MKKIQSFSKLVELVRSNKVYSLGYKIEEYPSDLQVNFSCKSNVICSALIEDICELSRNYNNMHCYCTIDKDKAVFCVFITLD